ncbi:MAG: hypothetical protein R2822_11330 [Spirosomataceae bacterium]
MNLGYAVELIVAGISGHSQNLSGHSGSLARTISLVDSEVKTIQSIPDAPNDLPNATQVNQAIHNYHDAVNGWEAARNKLTNTLTLISELSKGASMIDVIPDPLLTVDNIKMGLGIALDTVNQLNKQIQNALADIQQLENTVDASYRDNATALQGTSDEVSRQEQQLNDQVQSLKNQIEDMDSAKSIFLGVLTCGIHTIANINDIQNQIADCQEKEVKLHYYRQLYDQANSMILSCSGAIKTASISLSNISTVLQQYINEFDDMRSSNSQSLVVMKAYLKTFKNEALRAGEEISNALN